MAHHPWLITHGSSPILTVRLGVEQLPSPNWPPISLVDRSLGRMERFVAGRNHACGTRNYQLMCFGNFPPFPQRLIGVSAIIGLAVGGDHTCAALIDDSIECFSGKAGAEVEVMLS